MPKYLHVIALVILAGALGSADCAAAPGDIVVEFMGSERIPFFESGAGIVHAFVCFELHLNSGIKEDCYGFYPRGGRPNQITVANGGIHRGTGGIGTFPAPIWKFGESFERVSDTDWRETSTKKQLKQYGCDCDGIVLVDESEGRYLRFPLHGGMAEWSVPLLGGSEPLLWVDWQPITKISGDPAGRLAMIRGSGMLCSEFKTNPQRFANVTASFKVKIDEAKRESIFRLMREWDRRAYVLTEQNCIDFVDSIAAELKLQRPDRQTLRLPAAYVSGLRDLNGRSK